MELRTYLRIFVRKWWIVVPTFLVTVGAAIIFTYMQTPLYSARATYVVVPSSEFEDARNFANGLDILGRRDEIAATFAEIASSRRLMTLAADSMSLRSTSDYSVSSSLLAGTNIIRITVEGPNPIVVQRLANAIGTSLEEYVLGLYEAFILVPLDQAGVPAAPSSPNAILNVALAAVLGLTLGVALAFLSEYLKTPVSSAAGANIIDYETGTYTSRYMQQRLREEMSRAKRNSHTLSLALMEVDRLEMIRSSSPHDRQEVLRRVAVLLKQNLREEDLMARHSDTVFAFLFPDLSGEEAKETLEKLQIKVALTPFEMEKSGLKFNLNGTVGVATYLSNGTSKDELMDQAAVALREAEAAGDGHICLYAENKHLPGTNGDRQ